MKRESFIFILFSIILLMCSNLLSSIGYLKPDVEYSFIRGLNPAAYLLALLYIYLFFRYKLHLYKSAVLFLAFLFVLIPFNLLTGRNVDMKMMTTSFILPILTFIFLQLYQTTKNVLLARKVIVSFYIVECVLAILERIFTQNFFVSVNTGYEGFRSYSLIGHPLQNALCVSIMMSFILFSDIKYRLKLVALGIVAILCFNTRSTIVFWGVACLIYWCYLVRHNRRQAKKYTLFVIVAGLLLVFLVLNYNLGNRLLEMGLYDENSASVRLRIFDIFKYYSLSDFILGLPAKNLNLILFQSGVDGLIIENYWLMFVLRFGIIFTILLFICLLYFLLDLLKGKRDFEKWFIIISFLLISSTNNSLSVPNNAILMCFVLCSFAFKSNIVQKGNIIAA